MNHKSQSLLIGLTLSIILLRTNSFHFGETESVLLLVVSGGLIGIGDGIMLLLWARFCSTLDTRSTFLFMLSSYMVGLFIYMIIVNAHPALLIACSIGGSLSFPFLLKRSMAEKSVDVELPTLPKAKDALLSLWRPVLLAALFAFMSYFTLFISGQQTVDVSSAQITSTIITLAVVLMMLLAVLLFPKKADVSLAYRFALPFSAGGFLLLAFLWNDIGGLANSMVAMGCCLRTLFHFALWRLLYYVRNFLHF